METILTLLFCSLILTATDIKSGLSSQGQANVNSINSSTQRVVVIDSNKFKVVKWDI